VGLRIESWQDFSWQLLAAPAVHHHRVGWLLVGSILGVLYNPCLDRFVGLLTLDTCSPVLSPVLHRQNVLVMLPLLPLSAGGLFQ
jgi:hypothetical protein